jgi:lysine decarboxylase
MVELLDTGVRRSVETYLRWCTPSVLPQDTRDLDRGDVSVSAEQFGSLTANTGVFAEATARLAEIKGASELRISVTGGTGANVAIADYLAATNAPPATVLIDRAAHGSVWHAAARAGLRVRVVDGACDEHAHPLPPSPAGLTARLRQLAAAGEPAAAVWLTSPTYDGAIARVAQLSTAAHDHDALVVVDQAWGALLGMRADLPPSAISQGADIVAESTHKLGGGLQQTAVLMWHDGRVDSARLHHAYQATTTTSPSIHLAASAETAIRRAHHEPELISAPLAAIDGLQRRLHQRGLATRRPQLGAHVAAVDPFRVAVPCAPPRGYTLARQLREHAKVIVERATLDGVLLLGTFQLPPSAATHTAEALTTALSETAAPPAATGAAAAHPDSQPHLPSLDEPVYELADVARRPARRCALDGAAGAIAAGAVDVYPPGIPVVLPGYRLTEEMIGYLHTHQQQGACIRGAGAELDAVPIVADHCEPTVADPAA